MTVTINYIQGAKRAICTNNAFAVVIDERAVDFIPASVWKEKGFTDASVKAAFTNAVNNFPVASVEEQKRTARQTLGL